MRRFTLLLSVLFASSNAFAEEAPAPTAPPEVTLTAHAAITHMHQSLLHVRQLLARTRDERNPLALNCVYSSELQAESLLHASRHEYRAILAGQEGAPALDRILDASMRAGSAEKAARKCRLVKEQLMASADYKPSQAPDRQSLNALLNPTVQLMPPLPFIPLVR